MIKFFATDSDFSCRSLDIDHLDLFTDKECTSPWTSTSLIELVEEIPGEPRINVYNAQAFVLPLQVLYLRETTLGFVTGVKELHFVFCGTEVISLTD